VAESIIKERSYSFALKIIVLYRVLAKEKEYVLSRQVLKSGTSIGANVEEALAAQSRADIISKMSIASKEARETLYWLRLLRESKLTDAASVSELITEAEEIVSMLTSIVKTTSTSNHPSSPNKPI